MPPPQVSIPESASKGRERFRKAREVVERAIEARAFPGAAWGVLLNGEVVALDAAGRFTYEPDAPEVTPTTIFDLASLTKVMVTTAMAMVLCDKGRANRARFQQEPRGVLDLDARLGDVLPGFVIGMEPGSHKERVTMRMLLAHSSGLPGYGRLFEKNHTPEAMLRAALHTPLEAPPGTTRALGWDTPSEPSSSGRHFSPGSIGHLGYAGTSLWIDPERRLAVVLLTNRTWPDRSNKAIQEVRPAFHDAVAEGIN